MSSSFIIGFHTARKDNLLQTLRFLEKWHLSAIQKCELITVCQDALNFDIPNQSWLKHKHFDLSLSEMSLPIVTNFGIEQSEFEKIIILESDRILPQNYFSDVIKHLNYGVQITTSNMKKLTKECTDSDICCEGFEFFKEFRSQKNEFGSRNMWSGNTALMKSDFIKAGKMDESYVGYGWADTDMCLAMEKIGIQSIYREETELHLWHPPLTYGTKDQKKLFVDNGLRLCKKWNKPLPHVLRQDMLKYRNEEIL